VKLSGREWEDCRTRTDSLGCGRNGAFDDYEPFGWADKPVENTVVG
jgi:hypothetical protein